MANQRRAKPDPPAKAGANGKPGDSAAKPAPGVSLYEAQRRRTLAQAEREEFRAKELAGSLVRRDAVTKALFRMGREVRDGLENLPPRLSGILAAESDQEKIFALLSKEIQQVLSALSKEVRA